MTELTRSDPAARAASGDEAPPVFSLILPLYKSEANIPPLLDALSEFADRYSDEFVLECVFVVDGTPDNAHALLMSLLPEHGSFRAQVQVLSRNFGAPFALRCGLESATGSYFAPVAADLQEPFDAVRAMFEQVREGSADVCFGQRVARDDPWLPKLFSRWYWAIYRKLVAPELPRGGVDLFVCNAKVRDQLLLLREKNMFLVGQVFWMGFRRSLIPYSRRKRAAGKSSWTFRRRVSYLMDSLFLFSNLPIKVLTSLGVLGLLLSGGLGTSLVVNELFNNVPVPGYAATVAIICFFGGLNSLGLGIIGEYVWRTFQNTQQRPLAIVMESHRFNYPDDRSSVSS